MCKQVTYDIAYHPLPVIQIQVGETMGRKSGALRLVGRPPEVNLYNLKEPGIAWEPGAGPNILKRHSHGPMEPWDGEIAAGERGGLYVPGWEGWQRRPSLSVRRSLGPSEVWGDGEINQQNLWIVGVLRTIFTLQFVDMTLTWVRTSRGVHRKCDDSGGDEEWSSWQTPGICHFSQQDWFISHDFTMFFTMFFAIFTIFPIFLVKSQRSPRTPSWRVLAVQRWARTLERWSFWICRGCNSWREGPRWGPCWAWAILGHGLGGHPDWAAMKNVDFLHPDTHNGMFFFMGVWWYTSH